MWALPGWIRRLPELGRDEVTRIRTVVRVTGQTGLRDALTRAGLAALVKARGRTNPSVVLRYHAANQPHATALVYGRRAYSYFELDETVDRIAGALLRAGIGRGDSVVLMLHNVPELVMLQQAVGRIGAAAVTISWRSTPAELGFLLADSGARALFFDAAVADVVRQLSAGERAPLAHRCYAVPGEVAGFAGYEAWLATAERPGRLEDLAEEAALVIYTSGTTGKPKGAVRKFNRNSIVQILSFVGATPLAVGQTHLAVCPLYHSTAYGFIGLSFLLGNRVVLLDRFEPETFVTALAEHRVDHTAVVPTMLHRIVALGAERIRRFDTSRLKAIITGGAPLSATLAREVIDAYGDKLYNFYGATETGFVTLATPADLRAAPGTIGRAVGGNDILLLRDDGREAAVDEVGELYVRSGNLVEGYHADLAATRESQRDGYFSVGDLGRQDARGYFFLEGRKRELIISGGVNVYPREVEAVLTEHPAVAEAAVVGVPDAEWGERVHAFVALRPAHDCPRDELLAFCRQRLAGPKRPRGLTVMAALPRNPTGKVLKRQLRELAS